MTDIVFQAMKVMGQYAFTLLPELPWRGSGLEVVLTDHITYARIPLGTDPSV